jgi:hypothetical protein
MMFDYKFFHIVSCLVVSRDMLRDIRKIIKIIIMLRVRKVMSLYIMSL